MGILPKYDLLGGKKVKEISQKEADELIKQGKEEMKQIIESGGKVTRTIIEEKDKTTIITKIEPVEGKSTSSTVVQTKDEIVIDYL